MSTAKKVTVIQPTIVRGGLRYGAVQQRRRRVAGYARVSTDFEEQLTSYEAQVDYYTRYIKKNPDWEFAGMYTDEGISATNTKKREGFNRMIADALNGRIDLILTKSVSRFARNTVDTLTTVRKLKEKGVEVYFEKEQIYTLDSKGELLITIMSSLAQEESRSISENVTWGQRKRFADGKVSLPYRKFLGYEKGPDGLPQIVPEQAKTVESIYRLFLEGMTPTAIASELTHRSIPTPGGKAKWQSSTVESILTNEKYKGDALLQKKYTVDFLTKKQKVNEGEVPQYYVKNSHPAIISAEVFEEVQVEMARRKAVKYTSCSSWLSSRLVCEECGSFYGSKVWHSTDKYRRVIWRCNHKYGNGTTCSTPHVDEKTVKTAFVKAFNELITNKDDILAEYRAIIDTLTDCSALDAEDASLQSECEIVAGMIQKLIDENARTAIDQESYAARYNELAARYEAAETKLAANQTARQERSVKRERLLAFIDRIEQQDELITGFDGSLWNATVDTVTVKYGENATFLFKGGISHETQFLV